MTSTDKDRSTEGGPVVANLREQIEKFDKRSRAAETVLETLGYVREHGEWVSPSAIGSVI